MVTHRARADMGIARIPRYPTLKSRQMRMMMQQLQSQRAPRQTAPRQMAPRRRAQQQMKAPHMMKAQRKCRYGPRKDNNKCPNICKHTKTGKRASDGSCKKSAAMLKREKAEKLVRAKAMAKDMNDQFKNLYDDNGRLYRPIKFKGKDGKNRPYSAIMSSIYSRKFDAGKANPGFLKNEKRWKANIGFASQMNKTPKKPKVAKVEIMDIA